MIQKAKDIYREFPRIFWVLVVATFIDMLGGSLIFPFFSLFITHKFNVGMIQVGQVFAIFAIFGFFGNIVGGVLTDRFGRRAIIIFGLIFSALSSVAMGLINEIIVFYMLAGVVGLLGSMSGPARSAMVADMLPENKRAEAYGIMRIVFNLTVTVGPAIGGFLASRSYLLLFIVDAVTSLIMALIVFVVLPETQPELKTGEKPESVKASLGGYGKVFKDKIFVGFLGLSILLYLVYMQMNSTLPVYLRDVHGVAPQGFGYLMTLNAGMVVLLQFWVARRVGKKPPLLVMAAGALLCGFGFALYGFVEIYALFMVAMFILTIGEMFFSPVSESLVARLSPANMRGRYMAVNGFTWIIPSAIGPLAAGFIMDYYDPRWVWYIGGAILLVTTLGFMWMQSRFGAQLQPESETEDQEQVVETQQETEGDVSILPSVS